MGLHYIKELLHLEGNDNQYKKIAQEMSEIIYSPTYIIILSKIGKSLKKQCKKKHPTLLKSMGRRDKHNLSKIKKLTAKK